MDDQKTTIEVVSADPPPQPLSADEPFALVVADLTGARDEEAAADWKAHEVRPAADPTRPAPDTYEGKLRSAFRPRFRGEVDDHLSGKPGQKLAVDVTFRGTTANWPAELDELPELAAVRGLVRQLETLKRHLSQQPAVRKRLEALLAAAVDGPAAK